jgi:hypothetical protein
MSSTPTSDDEFPEVDDETLSEVVRRPTRTAGDLSEVADASPGITTEDLARDLEAVAPSGEFKRRASCSRTCSDGWSELRNISESTSPDHWGGVGAFEGQDSRDHLTLLIMAYDRWCLFNVPS